MKRAAAAALLAVALAAGPAQARTVRVFAVGPKFSLDWASTRAGFDAKLGAMLDRRERGKPGVPGVQRGADDVVSHLLGPTDRSRPAATARDLVVLPEDLGLMAAFSGPRAAAARAVTPQTGGLTAAIGALLAGYAPLTAYYAAGDPSLLDRGVPVRLLALAMTDTFARVAVETYARLADRYDVWLEAGVNMARDWRVVCTAKAGFRPPPGATGCDEENPAKVALLRAPDEPGRDYAYEGTAAPVNMALLFDPDGRLVSKQVKSYLTPVELPGQLDLQPGPVSGLGAVGTPVGVLGFVTSKDAWMPDVTSKLDAAGVEILVQPEFFVNDTVATHGMWAPDTLLSAGYSDLLRHPSLRALVLGEMTGNVYDFSADAQQHIALRPGAARPAAGHLVGQPDTPGMARVQDWVVPDPAVPGEPMEARRERLGRAGEAMLPVGDGPPCPDPSVPGPCKGGQQEGVIFSDVEVGAPRRRPAGPPRRAPRPFSRSRALAGAGEQRNVVLAAHGRTVWAAFERRARYGARWQVAVARSRDAGRTWSRAVPVSGLPAGAHDEWWPSLSAGPDGRLWVSWQDDRSGVPRAYWAASRDRGRHFSAPAAIGGDAPAQAAQWRPGIAATGPGRAFAAWIDEREHAADDALPQAHVYGTSIGPDGAGSAQRVDTGAPAALSAKLDNSWAPSVAAAGDRVLVAWTDFADYEWNVQARESADAGASFGAQRTVNRTPDPDEAICDAANAAIGPAGGMVAWTDWRKRDSAARRPHQLYDVMAAGWTGEAEHQVDPHADAQVASFAPRLAALPGGGALVAFEDHGRGDGDVLVRRLASDGTPRGRARRGDDAARRPWNAWRPSIVLAGGRAVVAWEDDRAGLRRVRVSRARAGSL